MSTTEQLPVEEPEESTEKTPERPRLELVLRPARFASWWSDLRPYLPTPANLAGPLTGVGAGSAALISRGWAWLWADGWQDAGMRAGGVVLAGYAGANTFSMAGPHAGYIVLAAVGGWCVAAKLHAPKTTGPKQAVKAAPEEPAADTPGEPVDEARTGPDTEAVRALLLDLMGAGPGVHLRTVLAHLQEKGQWEGRTVSDLRVHLEALGIPVDPKLKVGGTPTRGVRREALEA